MLREERHRHILSTLRRDGKIVATDLSLALGVSEDTVRRDLRELGEAGLLQRVHGGALPRSPATASHIARQRQAPEAKQVIARAAVRLLRPGQVILLDGGTTTLRVAHEMPPDFQATVITNSPAIAVALAEHPRIEVVVIGGKMLKDDLVTIGTMAVEALHMIRTDICLLGICSIHPDVGLSVLDLEEAHVKRAMITGASEVVALADRSKLGTAAPYVIGPIHMLTHLITEQGVGDEALAPYRAAGITVLRA
jgi:DeoR/GlpR family transcriptional regulator of sugar metabolism